jgi:hypothetical protein
MCDLSVPQGPEGRPLNVSPARTFLPRGAGWRIALYAVFVKKTAVATLSSAAKGEARGRAGESMREDEMSAGGAAPNLYLTVGRVWHGTIQMCGLSVPQGPQCWVGSRADTFSR